MRTIAVGIILHNPDIFRLKTNIDAIYNQIDVLVLVDNKSSNIDLVESKFLDYTKIVNIHNDRNFGISKALNQLMIFCDSRNFEWVLTLDQDSICPNNIIEEYMKYLLIPNIAIVSPVIYDRNCRKKSKMVQSGNDFQFIEKCITSGSLTNLPIWKKIGGFDELMFIDYVDFEYCKRVVLNGYKIIRINNVVLLHEIGHIIQHRFLIWETDVKNHSAIRKYYMARNILYYAKKYKKFGSIFVAYLHILKMFGLTLIYESDKKNKVKAILKGVKEGGKLSQ